MRKAELIGLAAVICASALLASAHYTRGHDWGDDFAGYLMQARSLADGSTSDFIERNTFTVQNTAPEPGPVAYPWGYPLLIAPFMAAFGLNLMIYKGINTLFYSLFLFALYRWARLRLPVVWSLAVVAVFAFNPALLSVHDRILSDIAFLLFSTLALYLIEKPATEGRSFFPTALIGAVVFAAFAVRVNGVLLLAPLAVSQWTRLDGKPMHSAQLPALMLPYLVFGGLAVVQALLLPGGQGSYLGYFSGLTGKILLENTRTYPLMPAAMFLELPWSFLPMALLLALFLTGLLTDPAAHAPKAAYILALLAALIAWPAPKVLRFVFPILPPVVLIAAQCLHAMTERIAPSMQVRARWAAGILGILLLGGSLLAIFDQVQLNLRANRAIAGPFDPTSSEMLDFVRSATPADAVVIFYKPRAMALLTGRYAFWRDTCEELGRGDYLVIDKQREQTGQLVEPLTCVNAQLQPLFHNAVFIVYRIE